MVELMITAAFVLAVACGFIAHGPLSRSLGAVAGLVGRIATTVDEINYAVVRQRELVLGTADRDFEDEQQLCGPR